MHGVSWAEYSATGNSICLWRGERADCMSGVEGYYGMNACVPQSPYVRVLNPNVAIFRNETSKEEIKVN